LEGIIGDIEGQVEVDFANENVGFGQTGTQVKISMQPPKLNIST